MFDMVLVTTGVPVWKIIVPVVIAYILGNVSPSIILGKLHGIDIKKEYFTAKLRRKPHKSPAVIVIPNRDIPGITPIPWQVPRIRASFTFISFGILFPQFQ